MFNDEQVPIEKLVEESQALYDEVTIFNEKITDPVIRRQFTNIRNLMVSALALNARNIGSLVVSITLIFDLLKTITSEDVRVSEFTKRLNEMQYVLDDELTQISEQVETLNAIHIDEADALEKLK